MRPYCKAFPIFFSFIYEREVLMLHDFLLVWQVWLLVNLYLTSCTTKKIMPRIWTYYN